MQGLNETKRKTKEDKGEQMQMETAYPSKQDHAKSTANHVVVQLYWSVVQAA